MGTSNIPVIDALRRLEGEGLLVNSPGIGTQVRRWEPQEVEELFLVRAMLEGAACRLFTVRATGADVALLEAYDQEYDAVARTGSSEEWFAADTRLHLQIVRAARSRELIRLVENSGIILLTIRHTMLPPAVAASWAAEEGLHAPVVRALKARNADEAEREIRAHIQRVSHRTVALLTDGGSGPSEE
jgi:DNA-binding GntR family transcriptional regulator